MASSEVIDQLYELLKLNMYDVYEQSDWPWNENKKRRELRDREARLILVHDITNNNNHDKKFVGFIHFRFLVEGDVPCLYLYELQLQPQYVRCGIGKRLMVVLEMIARMQRMEDIMMTVLFKNENAMIFYKSLGYTQDETSPQLDPDARRRHPHHDILSKYVGTSTR
jgi:ribosomal protein S18 acetylase RimI-like enzyme